MRIAFDSVSHPLHAAKKLAKALRAAGIDVTLGACREAMAAMFGYADWHELDRNCQPGAAVRWDHMLDRAEKAARLRHQANILSRRFGVAAGQAEDILATVRPSGHPTAERPIAWTEIADGRLRTVEGLYSIMVGAPLRCSYVTADREKTKPSFDVMITKALRNPTEATRDDHYCCLWSYDDMAAARAAAEREIRALRMLDRKIRKDGTVVLADGLLAEADSFFPDLLVSERMLERIPAAYRIPAGPDGHARYHDEASILAGMSLREYFTPLEIENYDYIEKRFPRLHAVATRDATKHEMLRAQLGMWEGWAYEKMLTMIRCGRPDSSDRVRIVYEVDEYYHPATIFDVRQGDRIAIMVPATDLDSDDFRLDFDRHEIVSYECRGGKAAG